MDLTSSAGGRVWFLYGLLLISLLLCVSRADAEPHDPTGNVNLSPFQKWRSAYECLQKISDSCPEKYKLTDAGWLNVTDGDAESFCNGGCAEITKTVLTCIDQVKPDYKFVNMATLQDVKDFITKGCASGFNGTIFSSNARRMSGSKITFFISILPVLFIMSL
ncbi:Glycine-rich protein family [Melia azedarach]|uniref:Glycine-rich protein family n=1 Tax=Melia azedarach TaxID=155640 RepID=A0ACC1YA26_MELAZ|nr:Glycine-rich protein family [Melia azedarach]